MTIDRDLIQRLAERLDYLNSNYNLPCQSALIAEALDYLDQPEPDGPTEEIDDLSPAQKALAAFNERCGLCFSVHDDWIAQCLAAALEAVADQVAPGPWRVNSCCDQREHSVRGGILAIAAELRGTTTTTETIS